MTPEKPFRTESLLGVVIPVKEIHAEALSTLGSLAAGAPMLEFVAVGKRTSNLAEIPDNLSIVDEDCSIYEAMNEGTLQSRSTYLLYMGIDDLLISENVATLLDELATTERADMIVLPFRVGTRLVRQAYVGKASSFHHQGVLFRRAAVLETGGYSRSYQLHSDLELMFRIQEYRSIGNLRMPLVEFSKGGATTSGRHAITSINEISDIYVARGVSRFCFNFFTSVTLLGCYAVRFWGDALLLLMRYRFRGSK